MTQNAKETVGALIILGAMAALAFFAISAALTAKP